jgi:DNA-binding response OmpR family regulator
MSFVVNNIDLNILGSNTFSNILKELEFINILNFKKFVFDNKQKFIVKVLFPENLKVKDVKEYLSENNPIILFLNNKDYLKKNNLILLNFHVVLQLPIEIFSFREILNILLTKYNFFQKSRIIINNYEIDSNQRTIKKSNITVKLTEKELELILTLNNNNGLDKSFLLKDVWKHSLDLDTHVFETHLHRLRKKIYNTFKDKNFITEKNSLYYLKN